MVEREIGLISKKIREKRKGVQKNKYFDKSCGSIIKTVDEEYISSENNIHFDIIVEDEDKYTINLFSTNSQTN